jgi:hypothetical protein
MMQHNNAEAQNFHETMPASAKGRGLLVAVVLFSIGLAGAFYWWALPYFREVTLHPTSEALRHIKIAFYGMAMLGTATAIVLAYYAYQILHTGQCPPPNAWMWRPTRIIRGKPAIRRAWSYIVVAALSWIICLSLSIYIGRLLDQFNAIPHVKIIQQKFFSVR